MNANNGGRALSQCGKFPLREPPAPPPPQGEKTSAADISRVNWNWRLTESGGLPAESIPVIAYGALQRIAAALEKLATIFDPEERKSRKRREAERQETDRQLETLRRWRLPDRLRHALKKKVKAYFAAAKPDPRERAAVETARQKVLAMIEERENTPWGRVPTPEEEAALHARAENFDPRAFDWSSLKLTALTKGRLLAMAQRVADGEAGRAGEEGR